MTTPKLPDPGFLKKDADGRIFVEDGMPKLRPWNPKEPEDVLRDDVVIFLDGELAGRVLYFLVGSDGFVVQQIGTSSGVRCIRRGCVHAYVPALE